MRDNTAQSGKRVVQFCATKSYPANLTTSTNHFEPSQLDNVLQAYGISLQSLVF